MKLFDELNDDTFELYAIRNYHNPICVDAEEFYEDLKRFKYVKRLITRYQEGDRPSVNLLLNHIVVILNVFGVDAGIRMLEYKVDLSYWHIIKPFLIFLQVIDNHKYVDIHMDKTIVEELRKL